MSDRVDLLTAREPSLVRLYMDLTGTSESVARSVFMHVCLRETDHDPPDETRNDLPPWEEPLRSSLARDLERTKGWFANPVTVPASA